MQGSKVYGKYCSTQYRQKKDGKNREDIDLMYFHVEEVVVTVVGSCSIPTRKVDIEEEGSTPFSPKDIVDTAITKLALVLCEGLLALAAISPFLIEITSLTLSLDVL